MQDDTYSYKRTKKGDVSGPKLAIFSNLIRVLDVEYQELGVNVAK